MIPLNEEETCTARDLQARIFDDLLQRNWQKYHKFIRGVRMIRYVRGPTHGNVVESSYAYHRAVDDIVDGDAPLPPGYASAAEFVKRRMEFVLNPQNPIEPLDYLYAHSRNLSERIGLDFTEDDLDILASMHFDAKRREQPLSRIPKAHLAEHFDLLDVQGVIRGTLKIYGEDPEKFPFLRALGSACRVQYNIRDFSEDTKAGYNNIPLEDCVRLNIDTETLKHEGHPAIREWLYEQAEIGMRLLAQHRRDVTRVRFGLLGRLTLSIVYERPARACFTTVLTNHL